ncbi:MAG: metallophosphoesterase family protein [Nitrosopumilaceae archaeon]|nr:metallophosphoesterase family protein [Nitrosopumilaceae archaeon]
MIIVQLSDLHIGSQFSSEQFSKMIAEVNEIKPDVVVVTGDITNEGLVKEYEKAKELLSQIKTKKIITISGNHDYRNTGYLLFKRYFPFETINELSDDIVLVTLGTARPDRNEGEVGYRQNLWLERTMKKYENKIKILAMHHHLIPIPDTGSDQLTVVDAGDVLRTILDTHVDLVLCGHKHRPWVWNFGNLEVINAGTVSSERVRGLFENTYNIITISDKKIDVDLKIVGGKRMPIDNIVKNYTQFGELNTV